MRRTLRALVGCLAMIGSACSSPGDEPDRAAALRRFVEAWIEDADTLAATISGDDAPRLVAAVEALGDGGVVGTTLEDVASVLDGDGAVDATAVLRFADTAEVRLAIHAVVENGLVRAEPSAVSSDLAEWETLRVERFGDPRRGDVLSRTGTLLASGPHGRRTLARPALAAAAAAVDEALNVRLGGRHGYRLRAEPSGRLLAEVQPADGEDVATSLDDALQAAAEATLGEVVGALVAVDPSTGGIRAMASIAEPETGRSPATDGYSPGSSFKIVTAAAALESGTFESDNVVPCPARITVGERDITNFEGVAHGDITVERAFTVSCNTAFARIGITVGLVELLRTAERLGFTVGELEGPGTIAVPETEAELGVWSFGAAGTLASPVVMAGLASTVASGGRLVSPGWIESVPGPRVLQAETADELLAMMEAVVESGTGTNAAVPGVSIAGKTGTADPLTGEGRSDAWFVGLAPARDARLAIVGLLPGAGLGGEQAAALVREFLLATGAIWRHD